MVSHPPANGSVTPASRRQPRVRQAWL